MNPETSESENQLFHSNSNNGDVPLSSLTISDGFSVTSTFSANRLEKVVDQDPVVAQRSLQEEDIKVSTESFRNAIMRIRDMNG